MGQGTRGNLRKRGGRQVGEERSRKDPKEDPDHGRWAETGMGQEKKGGKVRKGDRDGEGSEVESKSVI